MTARLRSPRIRSVARHVGVVLPIMAAIVVIGVVIFAATGSLGAGIGALFVLFLITWVPSVALAGRLDFQLDANNPRVLIEPDAVLIPQPEGPPLRLPRAGLKARVGWYSQRAPTAANPVVTGAWGVFLHLRSAEHDLFLHGDDAIEDAAIRGVKRFTSPPADKPRPEVRIWARELLVLAEELGVLARR